MSITGRKGDHRIGFAAPRMHGSLILSTPRPRQMHVAMMRCETGNEWMEGLFLNTHFWLDLIGRVIAWVTKATVLNLCSQLP